jgi:hypothetical protein
VNSTEYQPKVLGDVVVAEQLYQPPKVEPSESPSSVRSPIPAIKRESTLVEAMGTDLVKSGGASAMSALKTSLVVASVGKTPKKEPTQSQNKRKARTPKTPKSRTFNGSPVKSNGRVRAEDAHGSLVGKSNEEKKAIVDALRETLRGEGKEVFECEHKDCFTMQVLKSEARLLISHHFGRNKAKTRAIRQPPRWCRKHYQRAAHRSDWELVKIGLILEQLRRVEGDNPGTTYEICLKKSEQDRLSKHNNDMVQASLLGKPAPIPAPAEKKAASMEVLQHIYDNFEGADKTKADCDALVLWCHFKLTNGSMKYLPDFEMIPNLSDAATEVEEKEDSDHYEEEDFDDCPPSPSPATRIGIHVASKRTFPIKASIPSSRISRSGGIKKP